MNREIKVKPKKRLGQNFLSQIGVVKKMIGAARIVPNETILEIGPGTGNLTAELIKTGNPVIAIEKDGDMAEILRQKFAGAKNFSLVLQNVLEFDETKISAPYKVIANLPFYAASPIIRKFLESGNPPRAMSVITQKEVAQRIAAAPPKSNILATAVQFYAAPKIIAYVSKGCFWPAPKVDAAILLLAPLPKEGERADKQFVENFFKIARAGFSHPRKILAGNLAQELNLPRQEIIKQLERNNISPNARAENLSVQNWVSLARAFDL